MKTTTTLLLSVVLMAAATASYADTTQTTVTTTTEVPAPLVVRDGFTLSDYDVMITRNGATKLVQHNMKLQNGIVIRPDGTIIVPGKMNRALHSGDWLSFDGVLTRAASGRVEHLAPDYMGDRPTP
jgi:hypothetical protein